MKAQQQHDFRFEGLRNFVIDGSDKSVQDIVSKLCFLAKIQKDEKVDVSHLALQHDTWWTMILRTISREQSRERTLVFIREVTDDALEFCSRCLQSRENFHIKIGNAILSKLTESKDGISNLLHGPYKDDKMFIAKLETLILILNTKVEDLKLKFKEKIMDSVPPLE
jgi:hypothetical protein